MTRLKRNRTDTLRNVCETAKRVCVCVFMDCYEMLRARPAVAGVDLFAGTHRSWRLEPVIEEGDTVVAQLCT